jgi:hypothetical protein
VACALRVVQVTPSLNGSLRLQYGVVNCTILPVPEDGTMLCVANLVLGSMPVAFDKGASSISFFGGTFARVGRAVSRVPMPRARTHEEREAAEPRGGTQGPFACATPVAPSPYLPSTCG